MTEPTELLPCPFCGAGQTYMHVNKGTWNGRGYGEPVSVEVRHWCAGIPGQPSRMIAVAGRDESSAIAAWNRRTPQPTQAQAGAAPLDEARRLFDAGWKAAALFCDREDVVADGIIGFGACPQFEAAFSAANGIKGGQHGADT